MGTGYLGSLVFGARGEGGGGMEEGRVNEGKRKRQKERMRERVRERKKRWIGNE